jgi:DNA-binding HxlR family transcriptional regulator
MTETESTPNWERIYSGEGGYLTKKGTVKILSVLKDGPKSFGELNEAINVSDNTLTQRLNEGEDWNVIERCPVETKSGRETLGYGLTERGKEISEIIDGLDLVSLLKERDSLQDEIERRKQIANWKAALAQMEREGKEETEDFKRIEENLDELSSSIENT